MYVQPIKEPMDTLNIRITNLIFIKKNDEGLEKWLNG